MTETEKKKAATKFAADWKDRGNEKSDTQTFWMSLLRDAYGFVKGSPARTSESACVAELMKMYQTLTSK